MDEPRPDRVARLRSRLTDLLALAGELSVEQRELLSQTLEELDTTIDTMRSTDDELRRLLAELTAAHEVVEAERERYRDLFQFAPNGYLVTNLDGRIREANRAAADLLNASHQALGREALSAFVAPRDRPAFERRLEQLRQGEQLGEWEALLQPRGGEAFDAALSVATIRSRNGRSVGLRWLVRDVSDRKRFQESLQLLSDASSRLATSLDLAETLPALASLTVPWLADWCLIYLPAVPSGDEPPDANGGAESSRFRLAAVAARSPRWAEFAQAQAASLTPDPVARRPIRRALETGAARIVAGDLGDLYAEVFPGVIEHALPRGMAAGSAIVAPLTIRGKTLGVLVFARRRSRALFGRPDAQLAEEVARRVSLAVDNARLYTEARLARGQAERREQQLADFLRMVAHDIQQPLSAAQWHLQALHRAVDLGNVDGVRVSEEAIEVAMQRFDTMIRDLVESVRLEVGQVRLNPQSTALSELVEDIVRSLGPDASRITLDLQPLRPMPLDRARFSRVLVNLLGNALKYSDSASDVLVRLREVGSEAILSVIDHGIGIAAEDLPHLFERGYRTASASSKADGLGMGLYITKLLVQAHHGRLWATSEPGQGSTFLVALPLGPDPGN